MEHVVPFSEEFEGTVTDFSAGNLSPLFTTSVANSTTTPALSFILTNAGANTYFGNATGSTGAPSYTSAGALTKTDDTNVTLTLGGNPTTSLLRSVSLTLGWTGTLSVARGGTGTGTAFTQGSVIFAGASGVYSQDNTNFFFNDTVNQLRLGSATILDATATNPITLGGTSTTYLGLYVQNLSSAGSSDLVVGNNSDNGNVTTGTYANLGINGSTKSGTGIIDTAGDAYLFNNLEDLKIGTMTAAKTIDFFTNGGSGTAAARTRLTINDTGLLVMDGTAAAPSIAFAGSTTTGFYEKTTSSIGFSIAGTERAYITSGGVWNFLPSSGGTLELGSSSQFMDFAGTVVPSAASSQGIRTNLIFAQDVNRTNIFSLNNNAIVGGSTTGLTLTNLIANRSACQTASAVGVAITNVYNYDAPAFSSSSSGTVTVTNEVAFRAPNATYATNSYSFYSEMASGTGRWGVYINGSARNYMNGGLSVGTTTTTAGKVHILTAQVTGSVNNPVLVLQSTATNDDVTVTIQQNRVATTNATATTCGTIATTTDYSYRVETKVVARRTGGTAGTAGDYATYRIVASANNIGGTLTVDAVTTTAEWESQAGWNATIDANGTDLRVRVTGAADNNITWHAYTEWFLLST